MKVGGAQRRRRHGQLLRAARVLPRHGGRARRDPAHQAHPAGGGRGARRPRRRLRRHQRHAQRSRGRLQVPAPAGGAAGRPGLDRGRHRAPGRPEYPARSSQSRGRPRPVEAGRGASGGRRGAPRRYDLFVSILLTKTRSDSLPIPRALLG